MAKLRWQVFDAADNVIGLVDFWELLCLLFDITSPPNLYVRPFAPIRVED